VGYAIVRYHQADIEYVARGELIRILIYAFLFFAILNHLHRQSSIQIVVLVLVFLGMTISFYALYQFVTKSNYVWHFVKPAMYAKRSSGTFICPNHLAGFLEMILPFGLAYVFMGRFRSLTKVVLGYASLIILAGIGVTFSRGGWLASGLALTAFFALLLRERTYRLPAAVFLTVLIGAGAAVVWKTPQTQERWQNLLITPKIENIRFRLWESAVRMWHDHFWWGVGPGHYDYLFPQYRAWDVQNRPDRVHNDYLNTLVDLGIAGASLVAAAWLSLYWGVFRTWKFIRRSPNDLSAKKSNKPAFVLGAAVGLLAILLHSFVDFNMHMPANAILAVSLMAMLASHRRFATDRYWISSRWWAIRLALTSILVAGVFYLGLQALQRSMAYAWLERARKAQASISTQFSQFKKIEEQLAALQGSAEQSAQTDADKSPARIAELQKSLRQLAAEMRAEYSSRISALQKAYAADPMDFATSYEIGEALRLQSWQGGSDYRHLAIEAMTWFDRARLANPIDAYSWFRLGMCLDWLGNPARATPCFNQAGQLDPESYFTMMHRGWHELQLASFAAKDGAIEEARAHYVAAQKLLADSLMRSHYVQWGPPMKIIDFYLNFVKRKLAELPQRK
jgi:O-antigen ligase/tetratricopeptide (TPR) repeat protein